MCEKCENENVKVNLTSEVFDSRLRTFLQNTIRHLPLQKRLKLKTFEKCGKKLIPVANDNVVLMKKDGSARFFGVATCQNAFACPYCASKIMSKHAANIAAAIDMMYERGKVAFMMTLTVKHFKALKCLDVLEILSKTWRQFGTAAGRKKGSTVFVDFKNEFDITHWVKVIEFTYNDRKGWNPHIHALFWVDKNRLQEVAKWEEKLTESWNRIQFNSWIKFFAGKSVYFGGAESEGSIRDVEGLRKTFGRFDAGLEKGQHRGLWISKEKDGSIMESKASQYICGWGADQELTGNVHKKASGKGSMTMHQLLESAANGNKKHKQRYLEFILAIRERKRVRVRYAWGMKKEIDEFRKTHAYEEVMVKKNTEDSKEKEWHSLITLSKDTWYKILSLEEQRGLQIRHNLLFLAANYDDAKAFMLIYEYLLCYEIDIVAENAMNYNFHCDIAEQYYNGHSLHRFDYGDVAC